MTYEKAIEIISDIERGIYNSNDPDTKEALRMAKVALITERLHLETDQLLGGPADHGGVAIFGGSF